MTLLVTILLAVSLGGYLLTVGLLARSLAEGRPAAPRSGTIAVGTAVLLHAAGLVAYTIAHGEPPLVGLAPSLAMLALIIGGFLLATCIFREPAPLGLVLAPMVALFLGAALVLGPVPAGEAQTYHGLWLTFHVLLAFLGYAALALAFAAGLLYLLQFRELKGKRFGRMFRFFPSLDTLDRWGRRALVLAFPGLTAGVALGWAMGVRFPVAATVDAHLLWGALTWFVVVVALAARLGGSGGDRRGAMASVVGFLVVFLSYVVLRLAMAEGRVFL